MTLFKDLVVFWIFLLVTIGLFKLKTHWKWLIIIPFTLLFVLIAVLGFLFRDMPNEINIKDDTEILYVNKRNPKKKIVLQEYSTGFLGDSFHRDTIHTFQLSPSLRIVWRADLDDIDSSWMKVSEATYYHFQGGGLQLKSH